MLMLMCYMHFIGEIVWMGDGNITVIVPSRPKYKVAGMYGRVLLFPCNHSMNQRNLHHTKEVISSLNMQYSLH